MQIFDRTLHARNILYYIIYIMCLYTAVQKTNYVQYRGGVHTRLKRFSRQLNVRVHVCI